jgi:protein gp37
MASTTKIAWTEATWNPVVGCTKVSPGCTSCYAEAMCRRFWQQWDREPPPNHFRVKLHPERLEEPLKWKSPKRVFVCSMSDFFHAEIPLEFQARAYSVMRRCPQHSFQILTKRPDVMAMEEAACGLPKLENVWYGITAENQEWYDKRLFPLVQVRTITPVLFLSLEPLLGPINLGLFGTMPKDVTGGPYLQGYNIVQWVIIGCESGPNRRPMELEWAIDLVYQCREAQVPVFVKQISINGKVSHNPTEWPEELRVREYPCGTGGSVV